MYPTNPTELIALLAVLAPVLVATFSGLISARTRAAQSRREDWTRIRDLTTVLYNKAGDHGYWSQIVAARELGDFRKYRADIAPLLDEAHEFWTTGGTAGNASLMASLLEAKEKLDYKPPRRPLIIATICAVAVLAFFIYLAWPKESGANIDNHQRCLALQLDMFRSHPRRADSRELFKTLACEHDGTGPIYAPPTDRERHAGKPLRWGGYPPPSGNKPTS